MEATIIDCDNGVRARVYYDDAASNAGWYARYSVDGVVVDDSQKIWHPDMPRRRDALKAAVRVATAYARKLG